MKITPEGKTGGKKRSDDRKEIKQKKGGKYISGERRENS